MVPGEGTRPIPDRVKEALFNIIGSGINGSSFWDMFAGTGSVGIEALSRGASHVFFTDSDRAAIKTIDENLTITGLKGSANIQRSDVFSLLSGRARGAFDYVFIAPPQYRKMWSRALSAIDEYTDWLNPDAWIVVQIDPHESVDIALTRLEQFDERTYGSTMLRFYEWPSA